MKFILTVILLLTPLCQPPAPPVPPVEKFDVTRLSEKGKAAFDLVDRAEMFSLGRVGVAGTISAAERAVQTLIAEKNGAEALANLTDHATPEGQLLALYGLRCAAPDVYARHIGPFRARSAPPARKGDGRTIAAGNVMVVAGCMIGEQRWADILKRIDDGTYSCAREK